MALQLSQKEKMLLEDQQAHEEICIQKYTSYGQQASDPKLKQLFDSYAQQEQTHYETLGQILQGQVPPLQQNQESGPQVAMSAGLGMNAVNFNAPPGDDRALCQDLLMTEKYISGAYDTTIFECQDANVRQVLNHIQKEEQQHGEGIFNYMKQKGWYQPQ